MLRCNLPVTDMLVYGDPDRVSQIIINLLANAVKFTSVGSVTLELDIAERKGEQLLVRVRVQDTGIGLTKIEKGMLFRPFTQPSSESFHESSGSGLGLVISKGLVELMGGTISVDSEKGQGTKVTFTFQAIERRIASARCPSPVRQTEQSSAREKRDHHILVVEDNDIIQRIVVRLVQSAGFKCSTANNGAEALALIAHTEFDLVFMDIHMPIMDGISATREIRLREVSLGLTPLPIIGLSGNAREEHMMKALNSGMMDYLTKPCKKERMFAVIDKYARRPFGAA